MNVSTVSGQCPVKVAEVEFSPGDQWEVVIRHLMNSKEGPFPRTDSGGGKGEQAKRPASCVPRGEQPRLLGTERFVIPARFHFGPGRLGREAVFELGARDGEKSRMEGELMGSRGIGVKNLQYA